MSIDNITAFLTSLSPLISNLILALIILIAGWVAAGFFRRRIRRSSLTQRALNDTLRPVLASMVYYFILLTALYAALVRIGVTPTTLLAAFGAAGLAIALALKDTLANIAAGVMLLFIRSLQVGDYVELPGCSGTIEEIGLFATSLRDSAGIAIYIPNNTIWSNRIQNFNRHSARKAVINISVSYDTDLKTAQDRLRKCLYAYPDFIPTEGFPEIYVTDFLEYGITISCRLWLPGDQWSARMSGLRVAIKETLDQADINIATRGAISETLN